MFFPDDLMVKKWMITCLGLWVAVYSLSIRGDAKQDISPFLFKNERPPSESSASAPQPNQPYLVEPLMGSPNLNSAISLVSAISEIQQGCHSLVFNQSQMASILGQTEQILTVDQNGEVNWVSSKESSRGGNFDLGLDAARQFFVLMELSGWTQVARQQGRGLEFDYLTSVLNSSQLAPVDQKMLLVQVWPEFGGNFGEAVPYLIDLYQPTVSPLHPGMVETPEQKAMRGFLYQQKRDLYLRGLDLLKLKKEERRKARDQITDTNFRRRLLDAYHSFTTVLPREIDKFKSRK